MEENKNLGLGLINAVTEDNIKDILLEGLEISLDQCLADGVLKEIPFFSTFYKAFKATLGIRDAIFVKKIFGFLVQLKDIPIEQKQCFIDKISQNENYKEKVGEKLILLIDQLDDFYKPKIFGNLFKAAIESKITYDDLLKLLNITNSTYVPDLASLKKVDDYLNIDKTILERLAYAGLLSAKLKPHTQRLAYSFNHEEEMLPEIKYELNYLGKMMIKYGYF